MSNVVSLFGVVNNSSLFEPHIEPPCNFLSFKDLEGVVGFMSCKETQDKSELERILWENGADITKEYLIRKVPHRSRTSNQIYDGFRVEFTERTDRGWLLNGAPSLEAQMFTKDLSLRLELCRLDPRNAANKKKDFTEDSECSVEVFDEGDCV